MYTQEQKKQNLIDNIDQLTDAQINLINSLCNLGTYPNKKDLLKLSNFDVSKSYDTATPIDYMRRILEIYPNIDKGTFIFDYSKNIYGELVNINDLFTAHVLEVFKY